MKLVTIYHSHVHMTPMTLPKYDILSAISVVISSEYAVKSTAPGLEKIRMLP